MLPIETARRVQRQGMEGLSERLASASAGEAHSWTHASVGVDRELSV